MILQPYEEGVLQITGSGEILLEGRPLGKVVFSTLLAANLLPGLYVSEARAEGILSGRLEKEGNAG